MYLTEEEAKGKWCPMVRFAHWNAPTGGNQPLPKNWSDLKTPGTCIASECMMWRSGTHCVKASETRRSGELKVTYKQVPHPEYCGLAGKP
jgi:hypothetical protein